MSQTIREVKQGQVLVYQGEVPHSVFLVHKGLVRGYNISGQGSEHTISIYGPGDFLPVGWVYDIEPVAIYFYEAMQDSKIELFDKKTFLEKQSKDAYSANKSLAKSYISALLHTDALSQIRAKDKLAKTLLFLAIQFGKPTRNNFVKIDLKLTQSDIGQLAGLTRETVAVELSNLKDESIVVIKSKTYTINANRLREIAGEESVELNLD